MSEDNIHFPDVIQLNVGGHKFCTTLATLLQVPDTMFSSMFSGRFATKPQSDGSYFIDRDGTHFRWILNYMRDSNTIELVDKAIANELLIEAKYYCMLPLVAALESILQGPVIVSKRTVFYIAFSHEKYTHDLAYAIQCNDFYVKRISPDLLVESSKLHCDAILISTREALAYQSCIEKYVASGGLVVVCTTSNYVEAIPLLTSWFPFERAINGKESIRTAKLNIHHPILEGVSEFQFSFPHALQLKVRANAAAEARIIMSWRSGEPLAVLSPAHNGVVIALNVPIEKIAAEKNVIQFIQNALMHSNVYK